LLGVFTLGTVSQRIRQTAALSGMVAGLCVLGVIKLQTTVAWPWYAVIGATTTFLTGSLIALLDSPPEDKAHA
jgi:hypothetical protein